MKCVELSRRWVASAGVARFSILNGPSHRALVLHQCCVVIPAEWISARTEILPVLGLAEPVLLPGMRCSVALTTVSGYGAAREATRTFGVPLMGVFSSRRAVPDASAAELFAVGTVAAVTNLRQWDSGGWMVDLRSLARARRHDLLRSDPFRIASVEILNEHPEDPSSVASLVAEIRAFVHGMRRRCPRSRRAIRVESEMGTVSPFELPGTVMPLLDKIPAREWQGLLECESVEERLAFVLAQLHALPTRRSES